MGVDPAIRLVIAILAVLLFCYVLFRIGGLA